MKAVCLAASAAILMAGCTTTFDESLQENLRKGCVAWSSAYALFQSAAAVGDIPEAIIRKVELSNIGVAEICDDPGEIVDVYAAVQQVINAYAAVMQELRRAGVE